MAACSMGHGDAGYCEHCPGGSGRGTGTGGNDKRLTAQELREFPGGLSVLRGEEGVLAVEYADYCLSLDGLLFAEELGDDGGSREELRALDASLSLDAAACAGGAVHEFAELIETDVRYALKQLRAGSRSRARDALARVLERIAGVTCEDAGV